MKGHPVVRLKPMARAVKEALRDWGRSPAVPVVTVSIKARCG
jgi:hypothetical protein